MPLWDMNDVRQGLRTATQPAPVQGFAPPLGGTPAPPSAGIPKGASLGPIYDLSHRMQKARSAPASWADQRAERVAARNADKTAGRMAARAAAPAVAAPARMPRSTSEPPPWEGGPVPPSGGVIV